MSESDPLGRAPNQLGAKLDAGKVPLARGLLASFPRACLEVAKVSDAGANKYTWDGWRHVPDGINRYGDALSRHIVKEHLDGPIDPDFGFLHAAHIAWNALARLELLLIEQEKNNV
jgi:hypothetical protein